MVRDDGPKSHFSKAGTPTMGGMLILVAIFVSTLLWADLTNRFVWVVLGVTFSFGLIGFWDDYLKLAKKNPKGLIARYKYSWQSVVGLAAAIFAVLHGQDPGRDHALSTVLQELRRAMGAASFIVLDVFMIVGMCNAVNLTDGLDGLAIMPSVMVGAALGIFAYASGNASSRNTCRSPPCPARASCRSSAPRSWARASGSSGSTPIPRRCSWATSARWRWAARSA